MFKATTFGLYHIYNFELLSSYEKEDASCMNDIFSFLHSSHFFYHVDFIAVVSSTMLRRYRIRFDRVVILHIVNTFTSHLNTTSPPHIYIYKLSYIFLYDFFACMIQEVCNVYILWYHAQHGLNISTYLHYLPHIIYRYWIFTSY